MRLDVGADAGIAKLSAVPTRTRVGVTRMYRLASLISRGPILLPRYSGVRPTSRPPTNTAMIASTSIPYRPEPTPPGATSPSIMLSIGIMPPSAVYESCIELTAPVEVSVLALPNSVEPKMPKRCSLPSIAAPASCGAVPRREPRAESAP